jgi:hypothetical protein
LDRSQAKADAKTRKEKQKASTDSHEAVEWARDTEQEAA